MSQSEPDIPETPAVFNLPAVRGYDEAIKAIITITRLAGQEKMPITKATALVNMLSQAVRTMNYKRQDYHNERRLDLLGAAAEEGAAVFEGIAIIPPASRSAHTSKAAAPAPVIDIEPGEAVKLNTAHTKPKKGLRSGR